MLEQDPQASYLIFDDTVLEKSFGPSIELTRKQWSGNDKKSVIRGIGVVSCVYVKPTTERFWLIDYRIFDYRTQMARPSSIIMCVRCWARSNIEGCRSRRCSWTPGTPRRRTC